jgi:hypothetical protein
VTGGEQVAVLMFGILCALLAVCAVVRAWVDGCEAAGKAQVEMTRIAAEAQARQSLYPPADWSKEGEL